MSKNAILIVLVLAGAGFAIWKLGKPITKEPSVNEQLLATISSSQSKDWQVRDALIRLAQMGDPQAEKIALAKARDENKSVRAGAAEALGAFETPQTQELTIQLLKDADARVRLGAIRGLALKRTPNRVALVKNELKSGKWTEPETLKLKEVLFRISDNPDDRRLAVDALIAFAKEGNQSDHIQAGLMAASLSPQHPKVLEYMKLKTKEGKVPALVSSGIYILATKKDPEITKNFKTYLKHSQNTVRIAALQTIPKYCPPDRWAALKDFFSTEKDPDVLRAAAQTLQYMGKSALPVLEGAERSGKVQGDALEAVNDAANYIRHGSGTKDPCLNR